MTKIFCYSLKATCLCLLVTLLGGACATTRYVDEGQYLLRQVKIELDSATRDTPSPSDLISYIGQKPNRKLFGLFDWTLGLYSLSNRESNSWLNRKLRQWGTAPVIFSKEEAMHSVSNLTSAMYNLGYLRASTALQVDTLSDKKVRATYLIQLGQRFRIAQHREYIEDSIVRALLHPEDIRAELRQHPNERYQSFITRGEVLSPTMLQEERRRITRILRNRGLWDMREEYIRFEVDTLLGVNDAWVDTYISARYKPYRLGKVEIIQEPAVATKAQVLWVDTLGGVAVERPMVGGIRPKILRSRLHFAPDSLYDQDAVGRTYVALSELPALRSVDIRPRVDTLATTPTLDVRVVTTTEQSKELVADLIATHSGGNLGVNTSLAWMHNNLFGGSEQFRILGRLGYEELKGLGKNHASYGGELSMRIPRLMIPFLPSAKQHPLRGLTTFSLSYDFLNRPEFQRNLFATSLSYRWGHHIRPSWSYTLHPLEVEYLHFMGIDEGFLAQIPLYTRMLSYRDLFVVSASFRLEYNSSKDYRYRNSPWQHSLRLHGQSAGNFLRLTAPLLGAKQDDFGSYALLGTNYAQFLRGEVDYSGLYRLGGKNAIAYRASLSAVYPYGNSRILPVDLRYFSGGSSSVRGWRSRELGVGSMRREEATTLLHQVGDLKLDLNLELRLRLSRSWEWAGFVDAGNIWTLGKYDYQPQGDFRFNRFYKEIALSTGMGLRWDFDYFIVRFDAGFKLYDPQALQGKRWVAFNSSLKDLVAFHLALGYPF